MIYIDLLLGIPLLWGAIMGFKKGLIIELATIVALILGVYGAVNLSDTTANYLKNHFEISSNWLGLIGFLVSFVAIVIAVFLLGKLLDKMLKLMALGLVNRVLGMIFGILKYTLILSILLFFFENVNGQFHFVESNWSDDSLIYRGIHLISDPLSPYLKKLSLEEIPTNLPELP